MKWKICNVLAIVLFCVVELEVRQSQAAQGTATSASKEQVLARWAYALGGRENLQHANTIHLRGSIETGGLKGTYERWTTARGELRTTIELDGAFRQTVVFDGQMGWVQDTSGTVHELSGDVFKGVVSSAYEASDSFLFTGRVPGQVEFAGEDASRDAYVLRLEPQDGSAVTVYLDKQMFLPSREETGGAMGSRVITFSDWRDFGGMKFPSTVHQSSGDARFDAVITTEQVGINPQVAAGFFEKPGDAAEQIQFANGAHEAVVAAEVYGEHIFVPVRVNGREAGWFFLDSGAGMSVMSHALAQKTGLAFEGAIRASGTGAGSASLDLVKNVRLDLPGAQVPAGTVAVWDFSSILPVLGRPWDGLVGYDVISRLVVRVDYEHKQITFYDPKSFVAGRHAAALAVTFLGNLPLVDAKITIPGRAPVDAVCAIDSGADGLHLSTPFTNANLVLEAVAKRISGSSVGAGGESKEFAGRIASLQLGPYVLREPVAAFSPHVKEGLLASSDIGALIGGEILRRFTVTFDFPHQRILLEPNIHFSEPFRANESGLSLLAEGADFRRFEVDDVEGGSPAALAGVRKGDVVIGLNGRPASELDLEKMDEILQQNGHAVPITVQRNGQRLKMTLELRARI